MYYRKQWQNFYNPFQRVFSIYFQKDNENQPILLTYPNMKYERDDISRSEKWDRSLIETSKKSLDNKNNMLLYKTLRNDLVNNNDDYENNSSAYTFLIGFGMGFGIGFGINFYY